MGNSAPSILMEILFVSHKYPPAVGGMEKQSFELIQGMKRFTKVHTIVYEGGESKLRFFWMLRKRILQTCSENPGITAIHFNDGLMAAICAGHTGYEHLLRAVTLHGLEVVFPNRLYQRFILPRFNRFDLIIAVSQATAAACIARGLSPEKVVVIPNGVDAALADTVQRPDFKQFMLKKYHLDVQDCHILVAMGRSVRRKGFSWFIQQVVPELKGNLIFLMIGPFRRQPGGFEIFLRYLPAFLRHQIALFAGFPTDEATIRQLLERPEWQDKVRHLGKLPFEDIRQILAAADAFVMPNIPIEGDMEGFGLVCLDHRGHSRRQKRGAAAAGRCGGLGKGFACANGKSIQYRRAYRCSETLHAQSLWLGKNGGSVLEAIRECETLIGDIFLLPVCRISLKYISFRICSANATSRYLRGI